MFGRRSGDDFLSFRQRVRVRAWPLVAGVVVAFVLAESLDDSDGDKSLATLLIAVTLGAVVYVVALWFRR